MSEDVLEKPSERVSEEMSGSLPDLNRECSLPDLNRDPPRLAFSAGPQLQSPAASVNSRSCHSSYHAGYFLPWLVLSSCSVAFILLNARSTWRSVFAGRRAWRIRIWNAQRAQDGLVTFWATMQRPLLSSWYCWHRCACSIPSFHIQRAIARRWSQASRCVWFPLWRHRVWSLCMASCSAIQIGSMWLWRCVLHYHCLQPERWPFVCVYARRQRLDVIDPKVCWKLRTFLAWCADWIGWHQVIWWTLSPVAGAGVAN